MMKIGAVALILASASTVLAGEELPACANDCLASIAKELSCSSSDLNCLCARSESLSAKMAGCIVTLDVILETSDLLQYRHQTLACKSTADLHLRPDRQRVKPQDPRQQAMPLLMCLRQPIQEIASRVHLNLRGLFWWHV
ncbi:hypothetical protein GQ607_012626 [Colletotrichum asianum]|uniref:CFEM domain-containing protein n=1 Tax=Colletotrichum asianum TaxID=702518 RepID=A0A8H3W5G1_9PEZI|nr:hypothetical protein GQ607_012626 [Colletotrichum asianum]